MPRAPFLATVAELTNAPDIDKNWRECFPTLRPGDLVK
jgi:hypothetical protein